MIYLFSTKQKFNNIIIIFNHKIIDMTEKKREI